MTSDRRELCHRSERHREVYCELGSYALRANEWFGEEKRQVIDREHVRFALHQPVLSDTKEFLCHEIEFDAWRESRSTVSAQEA
jgi:hypothetical protein